MFGLGLDRIAQTSGSVSHIYRDSRWLGVRLFDTEPRVAVNHWVLENSVSPPNEIGAIDPVELSSVRARVDRRRHRPQTFAAIMTSIAACRTASWVFGLAFVISPVARE